MSFDLQIWLLTIAIYSYQPIGAVFFGWYCVTFKRDYPRQAAQFKRIVREARKRHPIGGRLGLYCFIFAMTLAWPRLLWMNKEWFFEMCGWEFSNRYLK